MPSSYHILLALHLIGLVVWFAGLFYLVRLLIYHREALDKPNPDQEVLTTQFSLMENRLWKVITLPGLCITVGTGVFLLIASQAYDKSWFLIKTFLLLLLFAYHWYCGRLMKQLQGGGKKWSSTGLRVYNEIATLLLFAIVFCAKLKEPKRIALSLIGVLVLGVVIFLFIKLVKKKKDY